MTTLSLPHAAARCSTVSSAVKVSYFQMIHYRTSLYRAGHNDNLMHRKSTKKSEEVSNTVISFTFFIIEIVRSPCGTSATYSTGVKKRQQNWHLLTYLRLNNKYHKIFIILYLCYYERARSTNRIVSFLGKFYAYSSCSLC